MLTAYMAVLDDVIRAHGIDQNVNYEREQLAGEIQQFHCWWLRCAFRQSSCFLLGILHFRSSSRNVGGGVLEVGAQRFSKAECEGG